LIDKLGGALDFLGMQLLVTIIKDYKKVEDLLLAFVGIEITGSTILEGKGMGQLLGDVPIMADLRGLFPGSGLDSYLVLTVLDASKLAPALDLVEKICGKMENPSEGIAFSVPIGQVRGIKGGLI
tara:strand:+ start:2359 stop:2733 length:375 start_codon:yes stop_codon:yes gene_type:complete